MVNIKFPETDVVTCVFSLRNSGTTCNQVFDDYGVVTPETRHKLKDYYYRVPDYLRGKLAPGDFVVVSCTTGYQVCQVQKINEFCATETSKLAPVVAMVNLGEYFEELDRQKSLQIMKATLLKERKRLEDQVTWDLIAEKSPEFAAMLKAFRDAGGEL